MKQGDKYFKSGAKFHETGAKFHETGAKTAHRVPNSTKRAPVLLLGYKSERVPQLSTRVTHVPSGAGVVCHIECNHEDHSAANSSR